MFDWKKKVDDWKEQQRIEAEHQREEAEIRRLAAIEAEKNAAAKRIQDEKEAKLLKLAQTFYCHFHGCNVRAQKPSIHTESWGGDSPGYGVPASGGSSTVEDWSLPGDLQLCEKCKQWTCEDHIHNGICQDCAEKL
ncbi:MAG: hypothetical protein NTZ07_04175 [Candidatus Woesebacteria bacterium]|nr:hypothetical protein [Candidatus Woesebacteria bacterium]